MKRFALIILCLSFCFSCNSYKKKYTSPQGKKYFELDVLEKIIYDIHIADAMLSLNVIDNKDFSIGIDTIVYDAIFDKYSYNKYQIEQTFLYYVHNNIDSLNNIYDRIFAKLSQEAEEVYN